MAQKTHGIRPTCFMNMCMIEDNQGHVLVLDKINSSYTGITFPGGHVEDGESYYDAMVREVKEETGLSVGKLEFTGIYHWEKEHIHNLVFLYKTSQYEGELQSSKEGEVYWISKDDFLKQKLALGMEEVWEMMHSEIRECHRVFNEGNYISKLF